MKGLSLRTKVTLGAVLAGGIGLLIFGISITAIITRAKLAALDSALRTQAHATFAALRERPEPLRWDEETEVREMFSVVRSLNSIEVETPPGTIVYRSRGLGSSALPPAENNIAKTVNIGEHATRIFQQREGDTIVRIADDLEPTLATRRAVIASLFILGPLMLCVVALIARWFAARTLRPLEQIASASERITATEFDRRLPSPATRDEVSHLVSALNRLLDRLQSGFEQTRRFSADASHELKTPLTIIRGETESALREPGLPPLLERTMLNIQEETGRLIHIVENLLLLALADAGKFNLALEPLEFSEILADAKEDLEILAEPKNITVAKERVEAVRVNGDPHFLRQLVLNLFDNAIKYNIPGGQIRVSLKVNDGMAALTVANTGNDIGSVDRENIFRRFHRADRSRGGQGLGLSICREIAIAHKATLTILPSDPGWVVFQFLIPLAQ